MGRIYFLIFWIPTVASVLNLGFAWAHGLLRRPLVPLAWFLAALAAQAYAQLFSPAWAIGLVLQTFLAVYLGIRLKLMA